MNPVGLILFGIIAAGGWLWLKRQPPQQRNRAALKLAMLLILLGLLFLAITGRLHWLGALVALLLPLAQRLLTLAIRLLPWLGRNWQTPKRGQYRRGNTSQVQSRMIQMTLDHDSGELSGQVLAGSFTGRPLESLNRTELMRLLQECHDSDADSTRLMETYLEKRFGPGWQEPGDTDSENRGRAGETMSREEAYDILGLSPGADRQAIIDAHRRLMQRNHPDRGGSTWLAARINEAKSLLLDEQSGKRRHGS